MSGGIPRKLTDKQVREIRRRWNERPEEERYGFLASLGREFKVSSQAIWLLVNRLTYKELK